MATWPLDCNRLTFVDGLAGLPLDWPAEAPAGCQPLKNGLQVSFKAMQTKGRNDRLDTQRRDQMSDGDGLHYEVYGRPV